MLSRNRGVTWLLAVAATVVVISGGPALAGMLDGHSGAFSDGSTTWTGQTLFDNGTGLSGYVDWAVFAPGVFPYAGYTPTPGEMVYAYQVFNTGADALTLFTVPLSNPADNIGVFADLSGDAQTAMLLLPSPSGKAEWQFAGILSPGNSIGLAFSSLYLPEETFATAVDGGAFSVIVPIPSPSSVILPEPITVSLLAAGATVLVGRRRNRRPAHEGPARGPTLG